ncbi:sugar phosphate isomerase/epimerase [Pseudonocardia sp.]|uniref:sugar phosphate isomerase/epimerase family protein n=1 Tax=Pseudonocardia sp. TaxID=60912 RepID=UPI0026217326|nr:sugar phosphate isomerase/epimerase family protein [Pseudonocardia sp.]MCW2722368.1 sugar phosphate isomerase/epimerase [Pseudonocardia sp.]
MFRYAAEILPYHDYPLEVSIRELARLGFTEVNLWSAARPLADHVQPGDDVSKIRALLDRYGMRPCGLTAYGNDVDGMIARVELARDLGIDTIIFDCEANYSDFVSTFLPPIAAAAARNGVRIAVENHLAVPFTPEFESGGNENKRWEEAVDSLAQIKRLVREVDDPNVGICLAPPHLWVMGESVSEAITFLAERKRLFYYYIWDIDRAYKHGVDGLNFGPGEKQLARPDGTLDHVVTLGTLKRVGYEGPASVKCHGTAGWPLAKVNAELAKADAYVKQCVTRI